MHIAFLFCTHYDLKGFISGYVVRVLARLDEEFRYIVYTDAHVAFDIANAFASEALSFTAGTDHGAELVVLFEPVRKELDAHGLRCSFDGCFDRDGVHAYSRAARRYHLGCQFKRLLRSKVEHRCHLRMVIAERRMLYHVFSGTDDPLRDPVLDVPVFVVPVLFEYSDPDQMVDDLLGLRN